MINPRRLIILFCQYLSVWIFSQSHFINESFHIKILILGSLEKRKKKIERSDNTRPDLFTATTSWSREVLQEGTPTIEGTHLFPSTWPTSSVYALCLSLSAFWFATHWTFAFLPSNNPLHPAEPLLFMWSLAKGVTCSWSFLPKSFFLCHIPFRSPPPQSRILKLKSYIKSKCSTS